MATYFVKTGGSDAANGLSDANAWATLSKVSGATFAAGDIIQLRRGDTWREQLTVHDSGSSGNPITYTNYGASTVALPIINGADVLTSWTDQGSNQWRAALSTQTQIVMFDGVLGTPAPSLVAVDAPREWFWSASFLYVYSVGNPNSTYAVIEAAVRPTDNEALININGKNWITIDGINCRHSQNTLVKNYAAGANQTGRTVRNCVLAYSADGGLCIYSDNFDHTAVLLERNDVSFTNLRNGGDGSGPLEGITTMRADGYEVAYNTVHHCVEEAICCQFFSKNGRIHHNVAHTKIGTPTFRPGIYLPDGSTNVEVDHNIVYGYNQTGCKGYQLNCESPGNSTDNTRWHHNIAYNCDFGMEIAKTGGGGGGHSNVKVYHNTFYKMGAFGIVFGSEILNALSGTNEIRNNIFDTSVSDDIRDFTTGNYAIANFTISHNFFVTGNPSETQGSNAVVAASPLFVSPATRDFVLQSGSPCRNAGTVIAGINDGYAESAPDIGALEYVGYIVVGKDATLSHAKVAGAASAAYALTGTAANLKRGLVVPALGGSYGLTGTPAELIYTPVNAHILGAAAGSYALAGTNASLLRGFAVAAAAGSYALAGLSVELVKAVPAPPIPIHRATVRIPDPHVGAGTLVYRAGSTIMDTYTADNDTGTADSTAHTADATPMRYT